MNFHTFDKTYFLPFAAGMFVLSGALVIFARYQRRHSVPKLVMDSINDLLKNDPDALRLLLANALAINPEAFLNLISEAAAQIKRENVLQKLFIFKEIVVVYEPAAPHGYNTLEVEKQIGAILTAYPNADLTKHETALGVKIIDVQRKSEPPSQPTQDMPIGKWE